MIGFTISMKYIERVTTKPVNITHWPKETHTHIHIRSIGLVIYNAHNEVRWNQIHDLAAISVNSFSYLPVFNECMEVN